ncbi:Clathrin/coatomer adaptor, adaptin-like protein [Lipomyces oligophaga]|uniref:Clathrin/coatomer adaptor, adaptin-like protein n=1 Tax=Lipomyces oligophaga TaxID=45792 RepID=UPI0034CF79D0
MSTMRGLVQFIADLRNARARELEERRINKELAHIRQKFKDSNLNGYQKKKYVCKLLYVYILGWNIDFGHLEALNLVASSKFSEKQIGYLAVSLLLNENHDLINLILNSIRKDLNDTNELNNCLALHAIANTGGREMAETLATDVHQLLVSRVSTGFVKKKAALTLLRLYRKYSHAVRDEWADRIISLLGDQNIGVVTSVASLVMALAKDHPELYHKSYGKSVMRLKSILLDNHIPTDYLYYRTPNPWLLVKLMRLLQYYPPSEDLDINATLMDVLQFVLDNISEPVRNVQQSNAQNAVLFEAIHLGIHIDAPPSIMDRMISKLKTFIASRETNLRYLGLDTMAHLAAHVEDLSPIRQHQNLILTSLKDRDISVRRKGLDLLYSMCSFENAELIISELLKYLEASDYAIREDMVIKIAILTEQHAMNYKWYIDTILSLISIAGDYVSDEVWQRAVQIVMNNEDLQPYAASMVLRYLKGPRHYESMIKIGGYVLGEFGHLIVEAPGCSPIEQLMALHEKMGNVSTYTNALLLSTFIKFVNLFPEIKAQVLEIFEFYSRSVEEELQQRACEYMVLATLPTDDLLRTICDEMPPFPERVSVLLTRLQKNGKVDERWSTNGRPGSVAGTPTVEKTQQQQFVYQPRPQQQQQQQQQQQPQPQPQQSQGVLISGI